MATSVPKKSAFPSSLLGSKCAQHLSEEVLDLGEKALANCRQMCEGAGAMIETNDLLRRNRNDLAPVKVRV